MKTKILSLFVALFATTALWASNFGYGDLYYELVKKDGYNLEGYWYYWEARVVSADKEKSSIDIPNFVIHDGDTIHVTSIGKNAFSNCTNLTTITISNSVTDIGYRAFSDCTNLTSVTIPNYVSSIGDYAFSGCTSLTTVTIPNYVSSIGDYIFSDCISLVSCCGKDSTVGVSVGAYGFQNCISLSSINVRKNIKKGTFKGCTNLSAVTMKDATDIGDDAFSDCTNLKNINIPEDVKSIGKSAFFGCTNLTSIIIPEKVESLGLYAFLGCQSLDTVYWNAINCYLHYDYFYKVTSTPFFSISSSLTPNITTFVFGNTVQNIPNYICYGMSNLSSIIIGNSVSSIGTDAFSACSNITSIVVNNKNEKYDSRENCNAIIETKNNTLLFGSGNTIIPNSVTSIKDAAFSDRANLTSITIPNSVTIIEDNVFDGCTGLKEFVTHKGITSIGKEAFKGCSGLESITIDRRVKTIGEDAFSGCDSLSTVVWNTKEFEGKVEAFKTCPVKSLTLGDNIDTTPTFSSLDSLKFLFLGKNVTGIHYSRFFENDNRLDSIVVSADNKYYDSRDNCNAVIESSTDSLVLGSNHASISNSVTSIGRSAFRGCTDMTSITIPNNVTYIEDSAFYGCTSLTSITIPNSVTDIGSYAFYGCTSLTSITIPNSVTDVERCAFYGCTGLTSVTIPNSVTDIGWYAFHGCTGLTSVTIPNSVTDIGWYAFHGCTGLTSVTMGDSVTSIGESAFKDCTSLTSITIPNSVTSIGEGAFEGCTNLMSLNLPDKLEEIKVGTFANCDSLKSIVIPHSVKKIGENKYSYQGAFQGCKNLTSVTIGAGMNTIGKNTFISCPNLDTVYCYASVPPTAESAFDYDRLVWMTLYVPKNSIEDYKQATEWKEFDEVLPLNIPMVDVEEDEPTFTPSYSDVTITWPVVPNADTYTILITEQDDYYGTETVCKLVFNSEGQLLSSIYRAPSYSAKQHLPAATMTNKGYQFVVTGLDSGTKYTYEVSVVDADGQTLNTYQGTFQTEGGTAVDDISTDKPNGINKVIRDGQVNILRGGKTYTLTGIEVK